MDTDKKIAVVIPAYRVSEEIVGVVASIPAYIANIIVVDDKCPDDSGKKLASLIDDHRLKIVYHSVNQGVGGAMKTGFKEAIKLNADIVVKVDGDGQMNPEFIEELIAPIISEEADFTKGNRFFSVQFVKQMPLLRLLGNSCLSLVNKFVTGYWSIMDPTNGFIAITVHELKELDFDKLENRYFFESDLLFRLSIARATVVDMPMAAKYGTENSSLKIGKVIFTFIPKYINRFFKRLMYLYFVRDFNAGSIQLFFGTLLLLFGIIFGSYHWTNSIEMHLPATAGTIMVAALPIILGCQLLLGFLLFDVNNQPKKRR